MTNMHYEFALLFVEPFKEFMVFIIAKMDRVLKRLIFNVDGTNLGRTRH